MKKTEDKLIQMELEKIDLDQKSSKKYEFVADHLEWGCEEGIVIFDFESKPLNTKYADRF